MPELYLEHVATHARGVEVAREIGRRLRQARLARGEDLEEAAERLYVQPARLAALEEGRFEQSPIGPHLTAMLRVYDDQLGLDGQRLIDLLVASTVGQAAESEPADSENAEVYVQSARCIAMLAVVIALLAAASAYFCYHLIVGLEHLHADRNLVSIHTPLRM